MITDLTGQQFGSYRLVRRLGVGGFANVYLGQHVRISSKQAAIKILHLFDVDIEQFRREAETTERLVHPNIVRLLDFDIQQGTPFLILDYAPGGSLRTRHPKGSQVPLATVIEYLKEIVPALQHAHDQHILHGDIKPDNILIGRQGELLLSDFGTALFLQTGKTSQPRPTNIVGTPYYMAPEQFLGKPERASDQYALATVVYEWLSGTVPFSEGDWMQLGYQHNQGPIPPLRAPMPTLPVAVEQVVLKALEKQPKDRWASVQDFASALQAATQPTVMRPAQSSDPPPPLSSLRLPKRLPSPSVIVVLLLLTLMLLGGASFAAYGAATGNWLWLRNGSHGQLTPSQGTQIPPTAITQSAGRIWHIQNSDTLQICYGVAGSDSQFVVVGDNGTILTSPDGRIWTPQNSGTKQTLSRVVWSRSQFVVVGDNGTVLTSPDGRIWTPQNSGTSQNLVGVTWGDSQFVAVGFGNILTSPDGRIWTPQNSGTSQNLWNLTWADSQFVVVGDNGTILTSPNGRNWTPQNSGTSVPLIGVAWSRSQFVVAGNSGVILASPDASTWSIQHSDPSVNFHGVIWADSQFVVVGGYILTSPNGNTWISQNSGTSHHFWSIAWADSQFVVVGDNGTILTSP